MKMKIQLALLPCLFALSGVAQAGSLADAVKSVQSSKDGAETRQEQPAPEKSAKPKVPPGHMPPAGKCRIWYHDREPAKQPAPGNCDKLRKQVPRGASLIRG